MRAWRAPPRPACRAPPQRGRLTTAAGLAPQPRRSYDVLVTNPPYSSKPIDHIERLMDFCRQQRKPFLILQPIYVYPKPCFKKLMEDPAAKLFYLTPSTR